MDPESDQNKQYHIAQDRMALLPNYYGWIYRHIRAFISGTVLELGVGAGHILKYYLGQVEEVWAVDHNRILLDRLAAAYPQSKVKPLFVDLLGDWRELRPVEADTVIALDVLEHFEDDRRIMEKIIPHLRPGANLILKVPAQSCLMGEIDRASGHFRRYDGPELEEMFTSMGFEQQMLRWMNPIGAILYRFKRKQRTNFSRTFSPAILRLANAAIPFLSALDSLPISKGQSILAAYRYGG